MISVKQNELVSSLRVVGELITNKILALDTSYLKLVSLGGTQYLTGFGSQHDLMVKLSEEKLDDFSVNVEYAKLMALVSYMQEDVTLEADNNGLLAKDGTVETYLNNLMSDNTDVEDVKDILKEANKVKKKGFKVSRKDFYETLRYLRGIQERDERTDIETGIMYTKDFTYVVSELYAVRHNFGIEENLVLDGHVTRVILPLLARSEEEEFLITRKEGVTYFFVGEDVYRVDGLSDDVMDDYIRIFNHRETEDTITMDKKECLRVLNLTKVLTNSTESDINFEVEEGKGKIFVSTQDGDTVDSDFEAEECSDVEFTVSVDDMVSIIGKLPNNVAEELTLDVINIPEEFKYEEPDLLHLKHELGDCVFSINTDVE